MREDYLGSLFLWWIVVDFNNEATVGTPRSDILAVLLLQRRQDAINAFEFYNKMVAQGADPPVALLRASVLALFMEFRAALKNGMDEEEYGALFKLCTAHDDKSLSEGFTAVDDWLYKKNITKIDSRKQADPDDLEANNDQHQV